MTEMHCRDCGKTFAGHEPIWCCDCGGLLDLQIVASFDRTALASRPPGMWRYREALPLSPGVEAVSLGEPMTPLVSLDLGHPVWVKQDQLFPTGSYKDRGAAIMISNAHALGIERVVEDSSGNAGCAVAAYCARAGISCEIYVPADTSPAKLAQIEAYGAMLVRVPGSRQDTAEAVMEAAQTTYYASHSWNPYFFHGTKTFAYEVCEQLGWAAPDSVVLPVGNGTLLLGVAIGFRELAGAGVISAAPKLIGVQAAACAPLYDAFQRGLARLAPATPGHTIAEGIAIAAPVRGEQILSVVRESGGTILQVSDNEIEAALRDMLRRGFFIEPTSAATIAGLYRYLEDAAGDECIVSVFTGHGLKAAGKVAQLR